MSRSAFRRRSTTRSSCPARAPRHHRSRRTSCTPWPTSDQEISVMRWCAAAAIALAACTTGERRAAADSGAGRPPASSGVALTGAGATFPYPIYSKWFSDYAQQTGVKINYQSIGSGGGIRQLSEGTVDFGASDSPMKDDEIAKAKGPVMHFPTVLGA